MYVTSLELNYNSFYSTVTHGIDVTIELWCADQFDMLYVRGGDIGQLRDRLEARVGIREAIAKGGDEQILVTKQCLTDKEECRFHQVVNQHKCLSLPPHTYADGKIKARVVAPEDTQLSNIYNDLVESFSVFVARKQKVADSPPNIPLLLSGSSLPDLSGQQRKAMQVAYRKGYYDIPRGCTAEDVAVELGVSRRTVQEHLRRAEQKFVDFFIDFV